MTTGFLQLRSVLLMRLRLALLVAMLTLGFASTGWTQETNTVGANAIGEVSTEADSPADGNGYPLTLANRTIFYFRASLGDYSAEERRAAADVRLRSVLDKAKTILVTTLAVPGGVQVCLDGKSLFVVSPGDISSIRGETVESSAVKSAAALRQAIFEMNALTSWPQLAKAFGLALLFTGLLVLVVWLTGKIRMWLQLRITKLAAVKTENVKSRELRRVGLKSFVAVLRAMMNLVSWLFIAFAAYTWLIQVMRCFPYARPWGEFLHQQILAVEFSLGRSLLMALPGILVVVLIALVARMLVQISNNLFAAVEETDGGVHWLDAHTAPTTRRIVVFLVWVAAVVVAYPYIPGSTSLAFKGMTVFAGLVISMGSSSLVNQLASGLLLIYSRAYRPGDYVRFGDTEGTVMGVGIFSTYIRTIKNEEVHIANSVLIGAATKNYSRLANSDGLLLPTRVTIGYNTPWRQVEAMLQEAARRTPGLLPEPKPFVLQITLADFFVEYELNARLEIPDQRVNVLARLHANIQDVFNENGVQIMSPHYLSDPAKPHIVPKPDWYRPPAKKTD